MPESIVEYAFWYILDLNIIEKIKKKILKKKNNLAGNRTRVAGMKKSFDTTAWAMSDWYL